MFIVSTSSGKMVRRKGKVIILPAPEVAESFMSNFNAYATQRALSSMDLDLIHEVMTTRYVIEPKPDFLKDNDIILFENL